ncbi:hypothetical protein RIE95_02860 [Acidithiobacillus thiooxidans]|jgi:hypothetical protein|uniref:Uncharacterized protein n=1 Tax=Acidithiobacillus thiooxidans ATCC 19377 TaxID=637390 RepID=A0A5P9XT06_ACITH|nr:MULTISPECIES: hypothetical protein [Acidithiobacillus]MDR7925941.1 hypothetical protein [Acidithiobacillus thiooxidans]QFX96898.1 hypothetical protein GCD22_02747 [Acidithiobacillus thiooxidans ATCC 19377]
MTTFDLQAALSRAMTLENIDPLDAATIAAAEQLSGKDGLTLDTALPILGNEQLIELIGFLNDSINCQQLSELCDKEFYNAEQAREWEVTEQQYRLAHEVALLSHLIEQKKEGIG